MLNRYKEQTEEEYKEKIKVNKVNKEYLIDKIIYITKFMSFRLSEDGGSIVRDRCIDLSQDLIDFLNRKYNKLKGV